MTLIKGEQALRSFRQDWTREKTLKLIQDCKGLIINWAVGVGKSTNIDSTIEAAVHSGIYDLVIALLPTRQVINERAWIQRPPPGIQIANLKPRPRDLCGDRDIEWRRFEANNLGALGRIDICASCPALRRCKWPRQYGRKLQGAQVIFATQAHLERSPTFITQLAQWTGAKRPLVLLDEVQFSATSSRRSILRSKLLHFVRVLKELEGKKDSAHGNWRYRAELLLTATTADLRSAGWRMPPVFPHWAIRVQRLGWRRYGLEFSFLAYDLQQFGQSPIDSREKDGSGNLLFAAPPFLNCDFTIYTGTAHPEFSRFRLGQDLESPFQDYRFQHPGTHWYNLASRLGTRGYFLKNADQILDFFAPLVATHLRAGRRPLLIAKKCFLEICAAGIRKRLLEFGLTDTKVVSEDWSRVDLSDPLLIPIIQYGIVGTNLFEDFDCAYCLTSYYVNEQVVDQVLQDVLASDRHIPIQIVTRGRPRRNFSEPLSSRIRATVSMIFRVWRR